MFGCTSQKRSGEDQAAGLPRMRASVSRQTTKGQASESQVGPDCRERETFFRGSHTVGQLFTHV